MSCYMLAACFCDLQLKSIMCMHPFNPCKHTGKNTISSFVMVDAFPSRLYWMFVRIAAVCFSSGHRLTKQWSCLLGWASVSVHILTCAVCSSVQASFRHFHSAHRSWLMLFNVFFCFFLVGRCVCVCVCGDILHPAVICFMARDNG